MHHESTRHALRWRVFAGGHALQRGGGGECSGVAGGCQKVIGVGACSWVPSVKVEVVEEAWGLRAAGWDAVRGGSSDVIREVLLPVSYSWSLE